VTFEKGSILETDKLDAACEDVDGVFHLAGIVKHSRDNPHPPTVDMAWEVNVDGTFKVFEAVAKAAEKRGGKKARIVYASSSGCVACQNPPRSGPGGDDSPLCEDVVTGTGYGKYGKFPYYAAKIDVEKRGMPLAEKLGLEVVWMRPTMMLGPGDHLFRSTGLVCSFLKGSIPMVPSGGASATQPRCSRRRWRCRRSLVPTRPTRSDRTTALSRACSRSSRSTLA
jgi:dihydroflavonol-4-reductase